MNTKSPSQLAWSKFRANLPAMIGLVYAGLCLLLALVAGIISPDNSRHANQQVLELAKMPPGSRSNLLLVPLSQVSASSVMDLMLGKTARTQPIALGELDKLSLSHEFVRFEMFSGVADSLRLTRFGEEGPQLNRTDFLAQFVQSKHYLFGTDSYGRDVLSRILLGSRVSLMVGLLSVLVSLVLGITLGTLAGYFGGWVDRLIMWLVSVMWAIPTLLLALAISFVLGRGFWQLFVAIGISMWVEVARIVRGQILLVREMPFAEAGRALGYSHVRLMFRHVLPNVLSPLIVIAVANFGAAVLIESGLSFLGIGVEVPIPSWGRMIFEGYTYIVFETGKWLAFFPGMALVLLIVSINLIGIGLRDALDVRLAE